MDADRVLPNSDPNSDPNPDSNPDSNPDPHPEPPRQSNAGSNREFDQEFGREPPAGREVRPTLERRLRALGEVVLCSDVPTQLILGLIFVALGFQAERPDGRLDLSFVVWVSLTDTVALVALMAVLIRWRGESLRSVFLGERPSPGEWRLGLSLIGLAYLVGVVLLVAIRLVVPQLHTVDENPLQQVMQSQTDIALFGLVAVLAGGVREELQRAFLLDRFSRYLGGPRVGVVATSVAFGAGHLLQGADAAVVTATLGAMWAVIFLRRRSVIAPMVSHAGFNLVQLLQFSLIGR